MNLFEELMRIAETIDDETDAAIVRTVAIQLAPCANNSKEQLEKIPGWGYVHTKLTLPSNH
jgi:hypothetical protein